MIHLILIAGLVCAPPIEGLCTCTDGSVAACSDLQEVPESKWIDDSCSDGEQSFARGRHYVCDGDHWTVEK